MASRQRQIRVKVGEIRRISRLHVTEREAAAFFGVKLKTFREMLRTDTAARDAWEEGRELGKIGLRRQQLKLAHKNAPMAIWLGKQWLAQSDVSTIQHTGPEGGPIKTLDLTRLDATGRKQLRDILAAARVSAKKDE